MQTIHILVEAKEGGVNIKLGVDGVGMSSAPELLAYVEVIHMVKTLLFATMGAHGVQDSIDAANEMIEVMEKIIAVRVMGNDDIVMSSGETFIDELDSLFEKHDKDQKSVCREILSRLGGGGNISLVEEGVIGNALEELARKIMNGELGQEEDKTDTPGTPSPSIFISSN
jgi:hypothetical protein